MRKFLFKLWNTWLEARRSQKCTGKQGTERIDTFEGESSQLPNARNDQLGHVQRQDGTEISRLPDFRRLTQTFEKQKKLRVELEGILQESAAELNRRWQDYNAVAEEYMNRANQNGVIGDSFLGSDLKHPVWLTSVRSQTLWLPRT